MFQNKYLKTMQVTLPKLQLGARKNEQAIIKTQLSNHQVIGQTASMCVCVEGWEDGREGGNTNRNHKHIRYNLEREKEKAKGLNCFQVYPFT